MNDRMSSYNTQSEKKCRIDGRIDGRIDKRMKGRVDRWDPLDERR